MHLAVQVSFSKNLEVAESLLMDEGCQACPVNMLACKNGDLAHAEVADSCEHLSSMSPVDS